MTSEDVRFQKSEECRWNVTFKRSFLQGKQHFTRDSFVLCTHRVDLSRGHVGLAGKLRTIFGSRLLWMLTGARRNGWSVKRPKKEAKNARGSARHGLETEAPSTLPRLAVHSASTAVPALRLKY